MAKKMTVTVSDEDYNWMMNFINSDEPNFDAPEMLCALVLSASFAEVKDE